MSHRKALSAILIELGQLSTKQARISFLHQNDSDHLRSLLYLAYDPRVKWLLPEGRPPYNPSIEQDGNGGMLIKEMRKLYLFLEGSSPPGLHPIRREKLFIQMLESVEPEDARLMLAIKDRKLSKYKGLSEDLVREAYPGLLLEEETQEQPA